MIKSNLLFLFCLLIISCESEPKEAPVLELATRLPIMGEVFETATEGYEYEELVKDNEVLIMPISSQVNAVTEMIEKLDQTWYRSGRNIVWSDNSKMATDVLNASLLQGGGYAKDSAAFIKIFVDRYYVSSSIRYCKDEIQAVDTLSGKSLQNYIRSLNNGKIADLDQVVYGYLIQVENRISVQSKDKCLMKNFYTQAHLYTGTPIK